MTTDTIIVTIRNELIRAISSLDSWFDRDDAVMNHRSSSMGCSVRELLEHVMITNRFLLKFIDQGSEKAMSKRDNREIDNLLKNYCLESDTLSEGDVYRSFDWGNQYTGVSDGTASLDAVRSEIREQLDRCLIHLELLENGEGVLYKTGLPIAGVEKLDIYQNIHLLALHVKRQLSQLQKILADYDETLENAD